ncbi:hypothetical protein [Sulfurospirillum sp. 1612]|uniref:hypothetical protein n=1 Tax=Sulfurospirillum sp. 1612 TaxID=3094835 RepID=UPI002F92D90C
MIKKEKPTWYIVTFHIIMTAIIFPFFGLLAGYFLIKFFGNMLQSGTLVIIKDIISIGFFFLGVMYSLIYIDKKILIKKPLNCSKNAILMFTILILYVWSVHIANNPNTIAMVYNTLFYGIIFLIFFIMTRQYFTKLAQNSKDSGK